MQTIQNLTDQASLPAVCQSRQRIIERTVSRSFTVVVSRWLPSIELKMFIDGKAMTCSTWALNHSWIHVSTLGFKPVALLSTPRVVSDFSMDLDKWFKQVFFYVFFSEWQPAKNHAEHQYGPTDFRHPGVSTAISAKLSAITRNINW